MDTERAEGTGEWVEGGGGGDEMDIEKDPSPGPDLTPVEHIVPGAPGGGVAPGSAATTEGPPGSPTRGREALGGGAPEEPQAKKTTGGKKKGGEEKQQPNDGAGKVLPQHGPHMSMWCVWRLPCLRHAPYSEFYIMWMLGMATVCAMAMKWGRGIKRRLGRMATSRESNPNHNTPTLILKARMVGRVRHSRARWPPRYRPVRGRYRRYCDRTCKGRESRGVKVDATHAPDKVDHRIRRGYSRCYWRPPAWWYIVGMLMLVAEGEAAGEAGGGGGTGGAAASVAMAATVASWAAGRIQWGEDTGARDNDRDWGQILDMGGGAGREEAEGEGQHEWTGHGMGQRGKEAGCRMAVFNAQRGGMVQVGERTQLENIMDYFAAHEVDIGVIQEPGKVAGNKEKIQRWAGEEGRNYEALVYGEVGDEVRTGGVARGVPLAKAGCIVLLRGGWAGACTNRGVIAGAAEESSRAVQLEFRAINRVGAAPLEQLKVICMYGYNDPTVNKGKSDRLLEAVENEVREFKRTRNSGSVVLVGDLNAAVSGHLDTDCAEGTLRYAGREREAHIIDRICAMGMEDVFREHHPDTRAWTREQEGQISRRLDYVMATGELVGHPVTRVGIHSGGPLCSDHSIVMVDTPINCGRAAGRPIPVWEPIQVKEVRIKESITKGDKADFNTRVHAGMKAALDQGGEEGGWDGEGGGGRRGGQGWRRLGGPC